MQLSTVKVSNILSFPYVENLTTVEGVKFHNHENGISNILIGPNGSGKSNLLDIISAIWKYGITIDYEVDQTTKKIVKKDTQSHNLTKFRGQENLSSHIYMSIYLTIGDITNMLFILHHREIINQIIKQYGSNVDITIPDVDSELIQTLHKVPFYCTLWENNSITLENNTDTIIGFVHLYFQNFELLQHSITIYNTQYNHAWIPLRNTFAFITYDYNYKDTSNNKPLRLLLKKYNDLTPIEEQSKSLLQHFFLESINEILFRYTNLTITIEDNIITFHGENNYDYQHDELSSGEQSFIRLIFLLYSHDLHNGLLMIDEPEIHLHPQAQKEFLKLIEEMIDKQHIQVILSTHSPSLINETNIHNVFRCTKLKGETKIYANSQHGKQSDSTLLQLLKFDAIAKVFFVDKIILVEGDTDLYFFSHYLEYLGTLPEWKNRIKNYEIIAMSGKWWVGKWKHFLKKYNTNVSYIGDWDNITEFGIISYQEINSLKQQKSATNRGSKYSSTVNFIQKNKPKLALHIKKGIQNLYQHQTFILQRGDLESYLGLQDKGLDDTVYFCTNTFSTWLSDDSYQEKREELLSIVEHIFTPQEEK